MAQRRYRRKARVKRGEVRAHNSDSNVLKMQNPAWCKMCGSTNPSFHRRLDTIRIGSFDHIA